MNKLTNPTVLKKAAKSALAIVLAGSFAFAGTNAFADSNDSSTNQTTTQQSTTNDPTTTVSNQESVAPSLLPGDFFYFAKIVFEKIQLALTFDQTKEAKLLASNASERLAEAQALYASGDQQKAVDTLKSALDDMNSSQKIVEKEDEQTEGSDSAKSTSSTTEDASTTKDSSTTEDSPEIKDVKDQLSQNIKALEAALEKDNKSEAAKKALKKNIMKFKTKLAGKNSVSTDDNQSTQTVDTNTDQTTSDTASPDVNATSTNTTGFTTGDSTTPATGTSNTISEAATEAGPAATTTDTSVTPAASVTTKPSNHGQEVSQVAKQATTQNHGQVVSQVAKSDAGKGNTEKGKH
jgi:hypothetical protein